MVSTKAVGVRADYESMPPDLQKWIEDELGSRVVSAATQEGGMSPGVAARLVTSGGRRVFVKAVGSAMNPESPGMHRNELTAITNLPDLPWVPRLLGSFDDGDWVGLLFEDIDGRQPHHPWTPDDADAVFDALAEMTSALTPAPFAGAPDFGSGLFAGSWKVVQSDPPADLDPWALDHLDDLVTLVDRAAIAVPGDTLTHLDIRADNTLITPAGKVFFVDWAHARLAAPWVGTAIAALDVVVSGSDVDVDALFAAHPCTKDTPADDVTGLIVAFTGMLEERSRAPDPPGLPTIRSYQRMAAKALTDWIKRRLG